MDPIVSELRRKLRDWIRTALFAQWAHYIFGGLGIISSLLAAASPSSARYLGLLSAALFAIFAFIQPMKIYNKFMCAARILQNALYEFDAQLIDLKGLLAANKRAEEFIETVDRREIADRDSHPPNGLSGSGRLTGGG